MAALKAIDPEAVLVHVEASGLSRAARQDLEALAVEDQHRGYIAYDLLTGRVTPDHPLFSWLVRYGASPNDLADLAREPITLDVIGLNFYPQWSTKQIAVDSKGRLVYRSIEKDGAGFATLIDDYYRRYDAPVIITETSAHGSAAMRARWLAASVAAIKQLRSRGVPVLGYTWFPMFTMVDWRYRFGSGPPEEYHLELGLYTLSEASEESRWRATPLVEQLRGYIADPAAAIGTLNLEAKDQSDF